jgi:hypothetical protein
MFWSYWVQFLVRPDVFRHFVLSIQANAEKVLRKYAVVSSVALFFSDVTSSD